MTWVRGVRWIEHGPFVISAGITSGIDASLRAIIRLAGDSVAERVAREIRYPAYRFALDPKVEQYTLRGSDLVLLANAAYRFSRPSIGVVLYDGVGELDLSNVYDTHASSIAADVMAVSSSDRAVVTKHGLTVYSSMQPSSASTLDRLVVPGIDARKGASSVLATIEAAAPDVRPEWLHADQPRRFGLEPVLEDLARTADLPTARFAQRRMEYRSGDVRLAGASLPWTPMIFALGLSALGVVAMNGAVWAARKMRG